MYFWVHTIHLCVVHEKQYTQINNTSQESRERVFLEVQLDSRAGWNRGQFNGTGNASSDSENDSNDSVEAEDMSESDEVDENERMAGLVEARPLGRGSIFRFMKFWAGSLEVSDGGGAHSLERLGSAFIIRFLKRLSLWGWEGAVCAGGWALIQSPSSRMSNSCRSESCVKIEDGFRGRSRRTRGQAGFGKEKSRSSFSGVAAIMVDFFPLKKRGDSLFIVILWSSGASVTESGESFAFLEKSSGAWNRRLWARAHYERLYLTYIQVKHEGLPSGLLTLVVPFRSLWTHGDRDDFETDFQISTRSPASWVTLYKLTQILTCLYVMLQHLASMSLSTREGYGPCWKANSRAMR